MGGEFYQGNKIMSYQDKGLLLFSFVSLHVNVHVRFLNLSAPTKKAKRKVSLLGAVG